MNCVRVRYDHNCFLGIDDQGTDLVISLTPVAFFGNWCVEGKNQSRQNAQKRYSLLSLDVLCTCRCGWVVWL